MANNLPIIDADGHIFERDEEMHPYLEVRFQDEESFRNASFFPGIDGWRRGGVHGGHVDAAAWAGFLDRAGLAGTIVYPTTGLGFGFCRDPEWAAAVAKAYNRFVAECYLKVDSRIQAVALLPQSRGRGASPRRDRAGPDRRTSAGRRSAPAVRRSSFRSIIRGSAGSGRAAGGPWRSAEGCGHRFHR